MKYERRKNTKKEIELEKETIALVTEDFDENEYIDEEFVEKKKTKTEKKKDIKQKKEKVKKDKPKNKLFSRKQSEDIIIYGDYDEVVLEENYDDEFDTTIDEEIEETKRIISLDNKIEEEKPVLKIEPIRKVTEEELIKISKKREQDKKKKAKKEEKIIYEEVDRNPLIKKIINIVFILCLVLIVTTTIDIVMVSRYEKGPYFAINTKTYKDGGSKEYYGIGYKVIKYNQLQGRKDMEIGLWNIKYDTEPITLSDLDIAIEFNENEMETFDKYYKKFVRIDSVLKKINKKDNSIIIGFEDEDGKYTMDIKCKLVNNNMKATDFTEGEGITIIGTVRSFKQKTSKSPTKLVISDCFAEQ